VLQVRHFFKIIERENINKLIGNYLSSYKENNGYDLEVQKQLFLQKFNAKMLIDFQKLINKSKAIIEYKYTDPEHEQKYISQQIGDPHK
jgi:hypothetical protein